MRLAHPFLAKVQGSDFYKLMGSGAGNGFSIWPDFTTFCLIMNWKDAESKAKFFNSNEFWIEYSSASEKQLHIVGEAIKARGTWDKKQPFKISSDTSHKGPIVILTRATIRKRWIPYFWSQVPKASAPVSKKIGHLFSKGVGELPLLHQATVSIWNSIEAMYAYAYQDQAHVEMIRKTRSKNWYKEELFAEFRILDISGNWNADIEDLKRNLFSN